MIVIDNKQLTNELLDEINFCRNNPKEFAKTIENHIKYITCNNDKFVYENGEFKIPLRKGVEQFKNCINILNNTQPLISLNLIENVKIICPDKLDEQHQFETLLEELEVKYPQKNIAFNYDCYFPKPEIILILQFVDDNGSKRNNILSRVYRNIGISVKKAAKWNFFSIYMTFSD